MFSYNDSPHGSENHDLMMLEWEGDGHQLVNGHYHNVKNIIPDG